ncbi:hypothetical protein IM816_16735 [Luteibacter flocculans]|uniref:Deaminase of polymorphic toxin system n=1 Tax=Luteibacter flocculans TaxID=2780091 RepID=A0ABY4SZU0_9GAMM|nr:deaminase domain-containing protein [Luteibacter flocculans]URL58218.1 hypothetical protein IM816_16735 [Luteibacter flocculans]
MNTTWKRFGALLAALAFLLGSSIGLAAGGNRPKQIHVGGNHVGKLDAEWKIHFDAIRNYLSRNKAVTNDAKVMEKLSEWSRKMTVANVEYTYVSNGHPHTRTYHARSGRSIGGMVRASERQLKTGSTSGSEGETKADVGADIEETVYYPDEYADTRRIGSSSNARVRNLNPKDSKFRATDHLRGRDAELKVVRQLESEIDKKLVPRGGRLKVLVSQPPCDSCTEVMRNFSDTYNVEVEVNYLDSATGSRSPSALNLDARKHFQVRKEIIKKEMAVGKVTAPTERAWGEETTKMLEEAAVTEKIGLPAGCE